MMMLIQAGKKGLKIGLITIGVLTITGSVYRMLFPYTFSISSSPSIATGLYLNWEDDIAHLQWGDMVKAKAYEPYFTATGPLKAAETVKRVAGVEGDSLMWIEDRLEICKGPGPKLKTSSLNSIARVIDQIDRENTPIQTETLGVRPRVQPDELALGKGQQGKGPARDSARMPADGKGECFTVAVRLKDDTRGNEFPKPEFPSVIPEGMVLLIAEHPASFDGRYYGLMPLSVIESKAKPLWVKWPDINAAWERAEKIYGDRLGGRPDRWEFSALFPPQGAVKSGGFSASGNPEAREPESSGESEATAERPDSAVHDSHDLRDSRDFRDSGFSMISGVIHAPSEARASASDS